MAQCKACGFELPVEAVFCPECGTPTYDGPIGSNHSDDSWSEEQARSAGVSIGFSKKIDSPTFRQAMNKSNRTYILVLLCTALFLPPVLGVVVAFLSHNEIATFITAVVVLYIVFIPIVVFILIKRAASRPWDGEVVDLIHRRVRKRSDTYIIVCRTEQGKKKKVTDYAGHPLYSYLQVGDRVRFHPRLNVPLEKYNKTRDSDLVCPFCGHIQTICNDYCEKCKKPLLK